YLPQRVVYEITDEMRGTGWRAPVTDPTTPRVRSADEEWDIPFGTTVNVHWDAEGEPEPWELDASDPRDSLYRLMKREGVMVTLLSDAPYVDCEDCREVDGEGKR